MNVLETLGYGGIVALIGILIVFLGLIILIVCISVMGKIFQSSQNKKAAKAAAAAPAPAPVAAPAPAPVAEPVAEEAPVCDDAQLIAVIAAALAAFDNGNKRLVVRKVRRVSGWNEAARSENLYHI